MNETHCIELLSNPDTNVLTYDKVLNDLYPNWLQWEPETLWLTMRKFTRVLPGLPARNKINAIKFLRCSEAAWTDWEDFCRAADGVNDIILDFDILHKPSLPEIFIAVWVMNKIRKMEFSQEVSRLLAAACLDAGVLFVPPPLDFLQHMLNIVEYRCSICSNIDLYDNDRCDICGAPDSALIKAPKWFDWKEVRDKWEMIKDKPLEQIELQETLIDIHLHKLLEAYAQLTEFREQHTREIAYIY